MGNLVHMSIGRPVLTLLHDPVDDGFMLGTSVRGKRLGIIGLGGIDRRVASLRVPLA
jgi:lactate dehydrogenase-like 2-hydroxyacid dehydrogenase